MERAAPYGQKSDVENPDGRLRSELPPRAIGQGFFAIPQTKGRPLSAGL